MAPHTLRLFANAGAHLGTDTTPERPGDPGIDRARLEPTEGDARCGGSCSIDQFGLDPL